MRSLSVVFGLLFAFNVFAADTYFTRESKTTGVSKDDAATIHELITSSLDSLHQKNVETEKGATYILQPRVLKLGGAYVVTIEKSSKGESVFTSKMKAERFEELDNVVERVVRSVVQEVAIDKNGTVKDVTENEEKRNIRRIETVNRWYLGMGPAFAGNLHSQGALFNFALGYVFEIDPEWALKIMYDGTTRFGNFNLGVNYYFSESRTTPFVTGSLGYGWADVDSTSFFNHDSVSGFVAGAGFGYQFFRTSRVNLEILLHGEILAGSTRVGTPTQGGLRIGILW